MNIPMKNVDSGHIQQVGYDETSQTLAIAFHKGGTYHYAGVSKGRYTALLNAESHSEHFNNFIKGVHPHRKL